MKFNHPIIIRAVVLISLMTSLTVLSSRLHADTGSCGGVTITLPFNDVMASPFFCQIAAAYFSGLTNGTTATTYSPTQTVTREQMAAFISRTLDQSLKRGSKKAVAKKWWTPQNASNLTLTTVSGNPIGVEFDGTDLWVACSSSSTISRVRAGDGRLLETWTGATGAMSVLAAMGKVFVTGQGSGNLYMLDPRQASGTVTLVTGSLGGQVKGISFDGARIWVTNDFTPGAVQIITPGPSLPWAVTTVTTGFNQPLGIVYDGTNIWVTDYGDNKLKKLDSSGNIILSVVIDTGAGFPVFDGMNIWVPNLGAGTVTVVRAVGSLAGTILATLTGNGLITPQTAAFDGERVLITNLSNDNVSLWKAADITPLGSVPTGANTNPFGACSDGLNFWITLNGTNKLARF